jgi:hypothetical protein
VNLDEKIIEVLADFCPYCGSSAIKIVVGWVERIPIFAQISKQSEKRNPTHTPQPLGFAFLQISKRPYKILTTLHPTYYYTNAMRKSSL